MQRLDPKEELAHLQSIYGEENFSEIYGNLRDAFSTLQVRSQILLSLVTICLTITGFSGPSIAASGPYSKMALIAGLCLVLSAGGSLLLSAFDLQWITRYRGDSMQETLVGIIERRNRRTRSYRLAMLLLVAGLTCYVASVVVFMLTAL